MVDRGALDDGGESMHCRNEFSRAAQPAVLKPADAQHAVRASESIKTKYGREACGSHAWELGVSVPSTEDIMGRQGLEVLGRAFLILRFSRGGSRIGLGGIVTVESRLRRCCRSGDDRVAWR